MALGGASGEQLFLLHLNHVKVIFTNFLTMSCFLPTGSQAQPGRPPQASPAPRAVPQQPQKATGNEPQPAPANTSPGQLPGPRAAGLLCAAFYGKWENTQKHPNIALIIHAWQHACSLWASKQILQTYYSWLLLRAHQQQHQVAFHCKDEKKSKNNYQSTVSNANKKSPIVSKA